MAAGVADCTGSTHAQVAPRCLASAEFARAQRPPMSRGHEAAIPRQRIAASSNFARLHDRIYVFNDVDTGSVHNVMRYHSFVSFEEPAMTQPNVTTTPRETSSRHFEACGDGHRPDESDSPGLGGDEGG